jgi:hypothetical protein
MPENITVTEIVKKWLKDNGYDGLCDPESKCGCELDDLRPCIGAPFEACVAAHQGNPAINPGEDPKYFYPGKQKEMLCPLRCTAAITRCRISCASLYVSETDKEIEAYCQPFFNIFAKKDNKNG